MAEEADAKGEKEASSAKRPHSALTAAGRPPPTPLLLTHGGEESELLERARKFNDADDADSESDLSDDSDSDDSDDDDEALQRELDKIRREREEAKAAKEAEEEAEKQRAAQAAAMSGNALLNPGAGSSSSSQMKRRWNDDVVFKGQASTEPEVKKRFVNDTIRSDFHRAFMKKYIQ